VQDAAHLDAQDELAQFRDRFVVTDPDLVYLDGNSLGRLPKQTAQRTQEVVNQEWGDRLIRGWGDGQISLPNRLGAKIAKLIGAQEDEVVVADSTSVNLFKLSMAALTAKPDRTEIVTSDDNFPSDLYVLQGCARLAGPGHRITRASTSGIETRAEDVEALLSTNTALLTLTHVAFKSGFIHDMRRLTASAHNHGALMLWDLSHSAGAVPVDLNGCNVDLAVGCTYKYLNGGPGAPAFLYVRRDLHDRLLSPIWGWLGERKPFDFRLDYEPAKNISRFFAGTPPILSMSAIEAGVDLLLEAGMDRLRKKSIAQTEYMIELWEEWLKPHGITLASPRNPAVRGSHVSLGHPDALRIDQALIEDMNVIPDFRAPDNIRFGVTPLYTSFTEIREGMSRLRQIMETKAYEKYDAVIGAVT
jgi:kynureninase